MPDANFDSGSFSSFGDMTSQNFLLKKGESYQIRILTPENGYDLKEKRVFMSRIVLFDAELSPSPCQCQQFPSR